MKKGCFKVIALGVLLIPSMAYGMDKESLSNELLANVFACMRAHRALDPKIEEIKKTLELFCPEVSTVDFFPRKIELTKEDGKKIFVFSGAEVCLGKDCIEKVKEGFEKLGNSSYMVIADPILVGGINEKTFSGPKGFYEKACLKKKEIKRNLSFKVGEFLECEGAASFASGFVDTMYRQQKEMIEGLEKCCNGGLGRVIPEGHLSGIYSKEFVEANSVSFNLMHFVFATLLHSNGFEGAVEGSTSLEFDRLLKSFDLYTRHVKQVLANRDLSVEKEKGYSEYREKISKLLKETDPFYSLMKSAPLAIGAAILINTFEFIMKQNPKEEEENKMLEGVFVTPSKKYLEQLVKDNKLSSINCFEAIAAAVRYGMTTCSFLVFDQIVQHKKEDVLIVFVSPLQTEQLLKDLNVMNYKKTDETELITHYAW